MTMAMRDLLFCSASVPLALIAFGHASLRQLMVKFFDGPPIHNRPANFKEQVSSDRTRYLTNPYNPRVADTPQSARTVSWPRRSVASPSSEAQLHTEPVANGPFSLNTCTWKTVP